jgi:tetraspanin-18
MLGLAFIGAGIWNNIWEVSLLKFFPTPLDNKIITEYQQHAHVIQVIAYILIVYGPMIFMIIFPFYLVKDKDLKYVLSSYAVFIIVVLILEVTAGMLGATYNHETEENTLALLKSSIKDYYAAEGKDAVTHNWDYTMANWKCCGVDSYEDFKESNKWTEGNKNKIPEACCILEGDVSKLRPKDPNCPQNPSDANSYWKKGCYNTIAKTFLGWKCISNVLIICFGVVILCVIIITLWANSIYVQRRVI